MLTTTLSVSGFRVNPYVDSGDFCHAGRMKQELQKLFVKRLVEEMDERSLSPNAVVRIAKSRGLPLSQPTVSRVLALKQDPTLEKIEAFSEVIGVPSWYLLTEKQHVEHRMIRPPANVVRLQEPYPRIFRKAEEVTKTRSRAKAKR